jgi:outer membrane lipoprotein-sorting protein
MRIKSIKFSLLRFARSDVFITVFSFCSLFLSAQNFRSVKDTIALKEKIEQMSKTINTIESDFTQEKNLSVLSEKVLSKGHFVFKKENMLRWEYSSPYKYLIVINKDKIWIKDDKKTSKYDMNSNKVFKEINDIMLSCVQGNIFKANKFKVAYFENDKYYKLELTPIQKTMKESLKKINMYFDKNVTSVSKLDMIEPNEDYTTLEFVNKKINGPVQDNIFTAK